jgi:O-antigen ligase
LILSTLCTAFVSLDIFLQFIYGKNILGYPEIDGRYGGVFGKEAIAGSYIQKLSMLAILPFFYLKLKKKINNDILIILITIILGSSILITLDRMPFFIYIFSLMLLLILLKNFRKIISLSILIIILFFTIMYKTDDLIHNRYNPIFRNIEIINSQIIDLIQNDKNTLLNKSENFKEKTYQTGVEYFALYNSAFYVLKNSFWLGSGTKSYYKKCHELRKNEQDLLCAPHPHNLYLEILVNQGIIGFTIFAVFLFFLFKRYFLDLTKLRINQTDRLLRIIFLIILIVELWPLRSYGSIFQTINGSIFWFILALASSDKYSLK